MCDVFIFVCKSAGDSTVSWESCLWVSFSAVRQGTVAVALESSQTELLQCQLDILLPWVFIFLVLLVALFLIPHISFQSLHLFLPLFLLLGFPYSLLPSLSTYLIPPFFQKRQYADNCFLVTVTWQGPLGGSYTQKCSHSQTLNKARTNTEHTSIWAQRRDTSRAAQTNTHKYT